MGFKRTTRPKMSRNKYGYIPSKNSVTTSGLLEYGANSSSGGKSSSVTVDANLWGNTFTGTETLNGSILQNIEVPSLTGATYHWLAAHYTDPTNVNTALIDLYTGYYATGETAVGMYFGAAQTSTSYRPIDMMVDKDNKGEVFANKIEGETALTNYLQTWTNSNIEVQSPITFNTDAPVIMNSTLRVDGNTTLKDLQSRTHLPEEDSKYDLGSSTQRWDEIWGKNGYLENLEVTGSAHFFELVIDKIKSAGGAIMLTPANGFNVVKVTALSNGDYKLYFLAEDDTHSIYNDWEVNDMACCKNFNQAKTGVSKEVSNQSYWCVVTEVSTDAEEVVIDNATKKCHYIVIDNHTSGYHIGTVTPEIGDDIVMLGHYSTQSLTSPRQSAIYISSNDGTTTNCFDSGIKAPFYAQYRGICDLSKGWDISSYRQSYFDAEKARFIGEFSVVDGTTSQDIKQYIANKAEESTEGKQPYVQDGYWYVWDTTTHSYKKDVKAEGVDGINGADGSQSNLYGYDSSLITNQGVVLHTKSGFSGFVTLGNSGYGFLNVYKSDGTQWESGTILSASCNIKVTNISGLSGNATVGISAEGEVLGGTPTATISSGGSATLTLKTKFTKDYQLYVYVNGTVGAGVLIDVTDFKIEDATNLAGVSTPFGGLAANSITQKPNLVSNSATFTSGWWGGKSVLNKIANAYQGNTAIYYEGGTVIDDTSNTYHIVLSESSDSADIYKPNTWYTISWWMKGTGVIASYFRSTSGDRMLLADCEHSKHIDTTSHIRYDHTLTSEWSRHSLTFMTPSSVSTDIRFDLTMEAAYNVSGNEIYICMPKVEEGVVPTEWQQSEADRKGATGATGAAGKDGTDGKDGKDGTDGENGEDANTYSLVPITEDFIAIATPDTETKPTTYNAPIWMYCSYRVYKTTGDNDPEELTLDELTKIHYVVLKGTTASATYATNAFTTNTYFGSYTSKSYDLDTSDPIFMLKVSLERRATTTSAWKVLDERTIPLTTKASSFFSTANGLLSRTMDNEGNISTIEQKADSIEITVGKVSNGLETTGIDIVSGKINLTADNTIIAGQLTVDSAKDAEGIKLQENGVPKVILKTEKIGSSASTSYKEVTAGTFNTHKTAEYLGTEVLITESLSTSESITLTASNVIFQEFDTTTSTWGSAPANKDKSGNSYTWTTGFILYSDDIEVARYSKGSSVTLGSTYSGKKITIKAFAKISATEVSNFEWYDKTNAWHLTTYVTVNRILDNVTIIGTDGIVSNQLKSSFEVKEDGVSFSKSDLSSYTSKGGGTTQGVTLDYYGLHKVEANSSGVTFKNTFNSRRIYEVNSLDSVSLSDILSAYNEFACDTLIYSRTNTCSFFIDKEPPVGYTLRIKGLTNNVNLYRGPNTSSSSATETFYSPDSGTWGDYPIGLGNDMWEIVYIGSHRWLTCRMN